MSVAFIFRYRSWIIVCCALASFVPFSAFAQVPPSIPSDFASSPVAVAVQISGPEVAYGDIIDYDSARGTYVLSQYVDDSHVFGIAVQDPPLLYSPQATSGVPVVRSGVALVNVTLENGPIKAGDSIITSSIPGKGMRAFATSTNSIGIARESFDGTSGSTRELLLGGKSVAAGTIVVALNANLHPVTTSMVTVPASGQICLWQCVPFGTLMRYLTAALVAFSSVYLGFRTFMADAVNAVTSIGRNPRAGASIRSMVAFNAVLAVLLALAGLIAGIVILFIQL